VNIPTRIVFGPSSSVGFLGAGPKGERGKGDKIEQNFGGENEAPCDDAEKGCFPGAIPSLLRAFTNDTIHTSGQSQSDVDCLCIVHTPTIVGFTTAPSSPRRDGGE
jgi:hypothetical protein